MRYTDDGVFVFIDPDGRRIPEAGSPRRCFRGNISGSAALSTASRNLGIEIDAEAIRSRWRGEKLDYDQAIEAMRYRSRVAAT
ncbi:MAG: hypothetical protein PVF63_09340 [Gammaproteobacteria bacterium]